MSDVALQLVCVRAYVLRAYLSLPLDIMSIAESSAFDGDGSDTDQPFSPSVVNFVRCSAFHPPNPLIYFVFRRSRLTHRRMERSDQSPLIVCVFMDRRLEAIQLHPHLRPVASELRVVSRAPRLKGLVKCMQDALCLRLSLMIVTRLAASHVKGR